MKRVLANLWWALLAVAGAWAYATLAFHRGEQLNSAYILIAALCSYAIGYRFYSKWLAARVLALNDRRATPCEVHDDGKDFVKTNKWIVFGQHFAAISGPGPLVGPVLAAQFGYLPGTLWILIGVTLGGAVQDFVVLFASLRRDGKSLGQMVKEELNATAGYLALFAILAIIIIMLAVMALVVVKALAESPWGLFTVGATIPIALFMGCYLRFGRVGKVREASVIGVVCLLLAVWGGKLIHESPELSKVFGLRDLTLAWAIILYGLAASVLPVWLLLAPRGYLSTFMKLGTIFALAFGIFIVLPNLKMPAISRFVDGSGLVIAGKVFPFCFITIACGAISGFHTLIASGTTPKMLTRESYARPVGYGAMCLESLVAIMALIAACTMEPGVYFGMNVPSTGANSAARAASITQRLQATGSSLVVSADAMDRLATEVKEKTLFSRTGGATTLAAGMATIFSKVTRGRWLDLWYHFAIMFEALFILTMIDAGTRAGRYLLQDAMGALWKPLGETKNTGANVLASVLLVSGWGYFLIQGVRDPLGGVNSLWPLFGIANQMLAAIGLCLGTTIILKMALQPVSRAGGLETVSESKPGRASVLASPNVSGNQGSRGRSPSQTGSLETISPAFALITLIPLAWLLAVTVTAGAQKIWHPDPRIGFLAQANVLSGKTPSLEQALAESKAAGEPGAVERAEKALHTNEVLRFNNLLDAAAAAGFLLLVAAIVLFSVREWVLLLARRKPAVLCETEPVWLPEYAVAESRPLHLAGVVTVAFALAKELSGEAEMERARQAAILCECEHGPGARPAEMNGSQSRQASARIYVEVAEKRFKGIKQCC
ncbi:MAG: carbon starvation CstA family protein [Verrucomicrobiota bacterium]|jgi:carbon starvation protein